MVLCAELQSHRNRYRITHGSANTHHLLKINFHQLFNASRRMVNCFLFTNSFWPMFDTVSSFLVKLSSGSWTCKEHRRLFSSGLRYHLMPTPSHAQSALTFKGTPLAHNDIICQRPIPWGVLERLSMQQLRRKTRGPVPKGLGHRALIDSSEPGVWQHGW